VKTTTYTLELLTPCFCAGADQSKAEIRAPAIRGQLRWWFRTLGGFVSLQHLPLPEQEATIFGSAAGDEGTASPLVIRVSALTSNVAKDADQMGAPILSDKGYLLFPLRSNPRRNEYKDRGVLENGTFSITIVWRGAPDIWPDIGALISVFGHLGALGFRSRRGFGALSFSKKAPPLCLQDSLNRFSNSGQALSLRQVSVTTNLPDEALRQLGKWLKGWRSHGRTIDHRQAQPGSGLPPYNDGFKYAEADHDAGYGLNHTGPTYRAALGLPIIQRCDGTMNNWELTARRGEGRFASPVLLRPHRDATGHWHALVIFVDAHAWPKGQPVYLNGQPRTVSLDLYHAMKADPKLAPFPA
jgi:CRISPR type III-B/RAMP module RAMP protein Cmr1